MIEPLAQLNTKRFQVALSFAGEHRNFIAGVAEHLSRNLGQNRVFYDQYYEAELARPNLDTYLMDIYREHADLIAIFLCSNYTQKAWCGLEWRVVRDVLKSRRDSEIMTFKFDDAFIEGLLSIDGYIDIANKTPEEVAYLILQRIHGKDTLSFHSSKSTLSAPAARPTVAEMVIKAHSPMIDREEAVAHFRALIDPVTPLRVLRLLGGAKMGKTHLLTRVFPGLAQQYGIRCAVLDLRNTQQTIITHLYNTCVELGWDRFPTFNQFYTAWSTQPQIQVRGLEAMWSIISIRSQSRKDDTIRVIPDLTRCFVEDLRQIDYPLLVFIFDQVDDAAPETQTWLMDTFLVQVQGLAHIRVVVGGRTLPDALGNYASGH